MKPLPDPYEIEPLAKPPNCTITVPGSKSITNRALILAALSKGKCTLRGALWADDTRVMADSLQKLGFEVTVEPDSTEECNRIITVVGRGGEPAAVGAEDDLRDVLRVAAETVLSHAGERVDRAIQERARRGI